MAKQYITLPAGIASYPHLTSADTTGKFADGKFKTKVLIPKDLAAPAMEKITAMAKALGVEKLPFKADKEDPSLIAFTAKSKFKPVMFAADGKTEITNMKDRIGSGSRIGIHAELWAYDTGVSLQMKMVQVLDLVNPNQSVFEAQEGSFDPDDFETGEDEAPTFPSDAPDI